MAKENKPRPKRLSVRFIETVKEPGVYGDGPGGNGLQLRVTPRADGGLNKFFQQRLTLKGKPINVGGIGRYPVITLAEAREKALENAKMAHKGNDPRVIDELKNKDVPTFAEAAEMLITERSNEWKEGSSSEKNWRGTLRRYALPKIGHKRVDEITEDDIIEMLNPLWRTKRVTAKLLLGYTRNIMEWCKIRKYRDDNPVTDTVREHAPRRGHQVKHMPFVDYYRVGAALQAIRGCQSAPATKLAAEFQILTANRHGSVRNARWSEIDWENNLWVIPAEHMKMERAHRVPLSSGAIAVLKQALQLKKDDSDLIFPSPQGGGIIERNTLAEMCRTLNLSGVPHGFRATFATWCGEKAVPQELAEAALAHVPDKIVRAYTHTDYLERRRHLMQMWSDYIEGKLPDGWTYIQATCTCGTVANRPQAA